MADVAQARPCPNCGTLVTVSGTYDASELTGVCPNPGCAQVMTIRHEAFVKHPVYGHVYTKIGADPGEAETDPAEEGSLNIDGYQLVFSRPVGGQWVGFVKQIDAEPIGGPTRQAVIDAAQVKIDAQKPVPSEAAQLEQAWTA